MVSIMGIIMGRRFFSVKTAWKKPKGKKVLKAKVPADVLRFLLGEPKRAE